MWWVQEERVQKGQSRDWSNLPCSALSCHLLAGNTEYVISNADRARNCTHPLGAGNAIDIVQLLPPPLQQQPIPILILTQPILIPPTLTPLTPPTHLHLLLHPSFPTKSNLRHSVQSDMMQSNFRSPSSKTVTRIVFLDLKRASS